MRGKHMAPVDPNVEVETKPTKAIVSFIGTLASGLTVAAPDGWTQQEIVVSILGAIVAATLVYGFKNNPK